MQNIEDVYSIGTFAQIHGLQDLGDRLRLVIMAHRRIKIVGQILEDLSPKPNSGGYFFYKFFLVILFSYS